MIKEISDLSFLSGLSDYKVTKNSFNKIFCYYVDNEIIGFIDYSIMFEKSELNYIFIINEFRNKSIGNQLIEFMINDLIKNKVEDITLEVNVNNTTAIKLYEKNKFSVIGKRIGYYNGIDALLMSRIIGD